MTTSNPPASFHDFSRVSCEEGDDLRPTLPPPPAPPTEKVEPLFDEIPWLSYRGCPV